MGEAVRLDQPAPSRPAAGVGALSGGDEALYRLLAENSNDAIACFDASGVFTYLSPAVGEVLDLYARGEHLSLAAALELEAEMTSRRAVDLGAFRAAGEATARRQRS